MIKIENVEINGWEAAIRGARNSYASWSKSDSAFKSDPIWHDINNAPHMIVADDQAEAFGVYIGPNDLKLMQNLSNTGRGSERKYLRFITVTCDITAPLYWWKEWDQSKVGTVTNSTSTMHSIMNKPFTASDFSFEDCDTGYAWNITAATLSNLNDLRDLYLNGGTVKCPREDIGYEKVTFEPKDKRIWLEVIQCLPASYNQKRTVLMNYEVLANQYKDRRNHRLSEWRSYCDWIETLPYSELIRGKKENNNG